MRLWTGNDGRYTVHASFVCLFQNDKVKLRKPNGSLVAVPLSVLCDADIAYIRSHSTHSKQSADSFTFEAIPSLVVQPIPKHSLPTITPKDLDHLPPRVLTKIASFLDVQSRLTLSTVTKTLYSIVYKPAVWNSLYFLTCDHYRINDTYMYQLVVFLQFKRDGLHTSVQHVILDGTAITANTIVLLLKHLTHMKTLSLKSCWQVMTFELATKLADLDSLQTSISKVLLGNVLHRGTVTPDLDSQSFGQDVWYIHTALNKLAHRSVHVDIALCNMCKLGAASLEFYCSCCGFLPLVQCITCAPRCDRCGVQTCGLDTCLDPKLKVQLARCGRCEQLVALCNNEKSTTCQKARKPCQQCHRLYHVQCRTSDGTYKSNQCSKCGEASCPHCELVSCSGGCHGQWCKKCVPSLGYCKCIVIGNKTLSKRYICMKCQKKCHQCGTSHFCSRCLNVHLEKC